MAFINVKYIFFQQEKDSLFLGVNILLLMHTIARIIIPIDTKGVVASWVDILILFMFDSIVDVVSIVRAIITTISLVSTVLLFLGVFSCVFIKAQQQNEIIIPDENEIKTPQEGYTDDVGQQAINLTRIELRVIEKAILMGDIICIITEQHIIKVIIPFNSFDLQDQCSLNF